MTIRPLGPDDSMGEITSLVRSAYAKLADLSFRFWGTWQSEEDTGHRCSSGHCLVAEHEGRLVGTVTVKKGADSGDPDWYRKEGVWIVTQFAVLPDQQAVGLGSRLLEAAEAHAFHQGGMETAIDTAEGATHLTDYYARRGYRHVGTVDWGSTNYQSVVMSKRLRPVLETSRLLLAEQTEADFPAIRDYWNDERFRAFYPPGRMTEGHCRETCEEAARALSIYPRRALYWSLRLAGEPIGRLRLSLERSRSGTIGYELDPRHWGNGYMTEAATEVLRYAFDELRLHRVQAFVFANNGPSLRVMERLGFVRERSMRERADWGDERVDDEVFGLLASEWHESNMKRVAAT